jgi:hypothetical protein
MVGWSKLHSSDNGCGYRGRAARRQQTLVRSDDQDCDEKEGG